MTARSKTKLVCFILEGVNSFAVILFFNYLYFSMRDRFGFDDRRNLLLAAALGFINIFAAWQGGKFGQRRGFFTALKTGFAVMAIGLAAGWCWNAVEGQIIAAILITIGMCFIWPALEALVSEGQSPAQLPDAIGFYNVVWAVTNAVAFFIGGSLINLFGYRVIFLLPLGLVLFQLALAFWLHRHANDLARVAVENPGAPPSPEPHRPASPAAKQFLSMAWLANPFAYIAINTLIAVIPGIAANFHLSPMFAGFICSLWCFVRLGAFVVLWRWTGWHYRFRWLVTAFVLLIASFAAILMASNLALLIGAQLLFGWAIGLIYYSSLFYSMDAGGDARGEHGGIHEAAIGAGNCVGPAAGAAALWLAPQNAGMGAWAVSGLLVLGLGGLLGLRRRRRAPTK